MTRTKNFGSHLKKIQNSNRLRAFFTNRKLMIPLGVLLLTITVITIILHSFVFTDKNIEDSLDLSGKKSLQEDNAVQTYTLARKNVMEKIDILGQIVFKEKVNISSKVNGRLEKIHAREGDKVKTGQLLAEIERLPQKHKLQQQRSELDITAKAYDLSKAKYDNAIKAIEIKFKTIQKAKADLNDKKVTYDNMDRILKNKMVLFEAGGLSESELETIKAQHTTLYTKYELAKSDYEIQQVGYRDIDIKSEGYDVPQSENEKINIFQKINVKIEWAELQAAKSRIEQARNNLKSTEILLDETYIRSPIYGLVASKNMEAGEMVKADSIIFTLINIADVFIAMNLSEKDITRVKVGQGVSFTVDAVKDQTFNAAIATITPVLDMKTRTIEVKASLKNTMNLLPGMFARATIKIGDKGEKLAIPVSSFINREKKQGEVYIIKKNILFKQKVEIGEEFGEEVEIKTGLKEGDVIISRGVNVVYPTMDVSKIISQQQPKQQKPKIKDKTRK